jgi:hypothetical protein
MTDPTLTQIGPAPRAASAISKSVVKAMGCEEYFAAHYLSPDTAALRRVESPMARTGTDFHRFRAEYVSHLVEVAKGSDPAWAAAWLRENGVTSDARFLIEDDIRTFSVDPDAVYGVEIFLSVGREFEPLELRFGETPGKVSAAAGAIVSGSIDRLEINGRVARVVDCKSGWSTATVSDYEPPNYAALVMAHFPNVDRVEFEWEFVRVHASKAATYTREDLPWIHTTILGEWARREDITRRYLAGERLAINPWAGLCQFCALRCPLRASVESGSLVLPPVQTEADARRVAEVLYQSEMLASSARDALRPFLDALPGGQLQLDGDFVLESQLSNTSKYRLLDVLDLIGAHPRDEYGQPLQISPAYMVPLNSLYVRGSELRSFAGRKKREGMEDKLRAIASSQPRATVRIRRLSGGLLPAVSDGEAA